MVPRLVTAEGHTEQLGDQPVFWFSAPWTGTPTLWVHGSPTSADDWLPFLERAGGLAPDLPGFGRSGKRGDGDFSIRGIDHFIEAFLAAQEIDRINLVVHDWGAAGLAFAQRFPERIERLVVIDALPLFPGYRWHWLARVWRTPVLGECAMGLTFKPVLRRLSRAANVTPGPLPPGFIDATMAHFDPGTQRAILKLYRSGPPEVLAAAGEHLGSITAPALVVWGEQDPYIPVTFAERYAATLPGAELWRLPDAGHWPWLDRPDVIERVAAFLAGTKQDPPTPAPNG